MADLDSTNTTASRRAIPPEAQYHLSFAKFPEFIEQFSSKISLTGMFLESQRLRPVGSTVAFDVKLVDGFKLCEGVGEVLWVRRKATGPDRPPGMGIRFQALDKQGRDLVLRVLEEQIKSGGEPFEVEKIPADGDAVPPLPEPSPAATGVLEAQAPADLDLDATVAEEVALGLDRGVRGLAPSSMDQVNVKAMVLDETGTSFSAPWGHELPQIPTEVLDPTDPVSSMPDVEEDLAEARFDGIPAFDAFDDEPEPIAAEPPPPVRAPAIAAAAEPAAEDAAEPELEEELVPDFEIPPLDDAPDFAVPAAEDVPDFAVPAAADVDFDFDAAPDDVDTEAPTILSEVVRHPPVSPLPPTPASFAFEPPAAGEGLDEPFADEPLPEASPFDEPLPDEPLGEPFGDVILEDPPPAEPFAADSFAADSFAGDSFAGDSLTPEPFPVEPLPAEPSPGGPYDVTEPADTAGPAEESFADVLPGGTARPAVPDFAPAAVPAAPPPIAYPARFDFEPDEAAEAVPEPAPEPEAPVPRSHYAEYLDQWSEPSESRTRAFLSDLRMAVSESKGRLIAVGLVIVLAIAAFVWREPLVALVVGQPTEDVSEIPTLPPEPAPPQGLEPSAGGEGEPEVVHVLPPDGEGESPAPPPTVAAPVTPPPPGAVPPPPLRPAPVPTRPVSPPPPANAPRASRVLLVSFEEGAGVTRVVIRLDGVIDDSRWSHDPAAYDSRKEWIELRGIVEPYASGQLRVGTAQLERIRTGLQDGGVLRVVFDFASPNVTLTEIDNRGDRLEVSVGPRPR